MPIEISEDVLENEQFSMVTDSSGDLVLEHNPTGGQFKFDSSANAWTPVQGLEMSGADISGAGSFDSNDADVSGPVVSNSLDTGSVNSDDITNGGQLQTTDLDVTGDATGPFSPITKTRAFLSTSSSADPVPLDAVSYDPDSNFDLNTGSYTVPATGTYVLHGQARVSSGVTGRVDISLSRNSKALSKSTITANDNFETLTATGVRELAAGDRVRLRNTTSTSLRGNESDTFLEIYQIQ
jgi:hypothetical protein